MNAPDPPDPEVSILAGLDVILSSCKASGLTSMQTHVEACLQKCRGNFIDRRRSNYPHASKGET